MEITRNHTIDKTWKPYQHAILVSTKSAIEITEYLLKCKKYEYVMLGRFTQDCVENVFSTIRSNQCKPNALQFKCLLKNLFVSQYTADIRNGNYDTDDGEYLSGFLTDLKENRMATVQSTIKPLDSNYVIDRVYLGSHETNTLYYVLGNILHKNPRSRHFATTVSIMWSVNFTNPTPSWPLNGNPYMI